MREHKRMKYGNQKICIKCGKMKYIEGNFRIVNAINGHTCQTCNDCMYLAAKNPKNDTRKSEGFLYVLFDSVFPLHIKIGYTTDEKDRLFRYNQCKPFSTCSYVYVSRLLTNILKLEEKILKRIYSYARAMPDRKEWFPIEHKEKFIAEIKLIEDDIDNHPSIN
jgi:hypothetical protein